MARWVSKLLIFLMTTVFLQACSSPYKIPDDLETNEKIKKVYFGLLGNPHEKVLTIGNLGISMIDYLQCMTDDYNYKWMLSHPDKYPNPGPKHPTNPKLVCPSDQIREPAEKEIENEKSK